MKIVLPLRALPAALFSLIAACASEPVGPSAGGDLSPVFAKGAGGVTYTYTVSGDVRSADGSANASRRVTSGSPFKGMALSGVTLTVGTPSGIGCDTRFSYASTFGLNEGLSFVGNLGRASQTGTLNFLGTRVGGTEVFQMSVSGPGVETRNPDGSYTLTYANAAAYSDSRTTYFDGQYRCVNVTIVATP